MIKNIISYALPFAGLLLLMLTFHVLDRHPITPEKENDIDENKDSL
ncbi:hypothetical protein [Bacillus sp. Marseille-P3661]|nr:hypothetical protein [Bacillus sp. Marseille-P3661]